MARRIETIKTVYEFKERIKKEEDAAYKFFIDNKETLCSADNLNTASKLIRRQLELNKLRNDRCVKALKAAEERLAGADGERQKGTQRLEATEEGKDGLPSIEFMRPASPRTRAVLFEGISATGGGRAKYLKLRNLKDPEDKYAVKYPTSWDYGWYFKKMVKLDEIKKPFNHTSIIKNTLFSRNGIPVDDMRDIIQKKRFG
ncbi:unnamed protein product [Mesocestoides corti]|uniref:Sperm microtubule inner protein 1 C-terminal domain-containing protein n=1 Tax=Mesocestoides corti TaxID=53468 RepID=A0A0R3UFL3_MESCO|nr:unnamed protein product [Mesocestoides corti]